jgi:hypothetical protein
VISFSKQKLSLICLRRMHHSIDMSLTCSQKRFKGALVFYCAPQIANYSIYAVLWKRLVWPMKNPLPPPPKLRKSARLYFITARPFPAHSVPSLLRVILTRPTIVTPGEELWHVGGGGALVSRRKRAWHVHLLAQKSVAIFRKSAVVSGLNRSKCFYWSCRKK